MERINLIPNEWQSSYVARCLGGARHDKYDVVISTGSPLEVDWNGEIWLRKDILSRSSPDVSTSLRFARHDTCKLIVLRFIFYPTQADKWLRGPT
ncbi:MAG: hypothetical protein JXM79_06040 [Sedimentisphaerales bacterium]|nr:hypothetical protein [Sedimentisphaerales bacterium]